MQLHYSNICDCIISQDAFPKKGFFFWPLRANGPELGVEVINCMG